MLWGLELDRRLRAAGSPKTTYLTHPGWVASNLSNVSDRPVMSAFHTVVKAAAGVLANDIDAGAAPTLYCITEPIPPGSYVGIDSRYGLKGGPTLSGRLQRPADRRLHPAQNRRDAGRMDERRVPDRRCALRARPAG